MTYAAIFYSHTDYSDVWPVLFGQMNKFLPDTRKYLFSDQTTEDLDQEGWELIRYDDGLKYQDRMVHCLENVEEEIILFHHEDMFLYEKPNEEVLKDLAQLIADEEIDIIKLIRASYREFSLRPVTSSEFVFENPHDLQYAIQPSLCNKEKLMLIYDKTGGDSIWEFEAFSSGVSTYFGVKTGMVYTENDVKRGQYHWTSAIYPYVATAIVKGKWNLSDYPEELTPLLKKYKIDPDIRGSA